MLKSVSSIRIACVGCLHFSLFVPLQQYSEAHRQSAVTITAHLQQPVDSVQMAMLPTPITPFQLSDVPATAKLHMKRDDLTGMQMSGNKARLLDLPDDISA